MPYLAKQKMSEDFERNRIQMQIQKEMEIMKRRAGYREEEQFRGRDIARELEALGTFLKTGAEGVKGLDRPLLQLLEHLATAGISGEEIPTIEPEKVGAALAPYTEMMAGQAGALGLPESFIEKMGVATQLKGSPFAMDLLEQQIKTTAGREARGLKEREIKVKEEELKLKGKKTPKEAKKELKEREKRAFSLREKIAKPPEDTTPEQKKLWKDELAIEEEEINKLKKQVGKKTDEDYRAMAAHLNREGFKIIDVDTNKDLRQWLTEQGYSVTRLRGFFLRGK